MVLSSLFSLLSLFALLIAYFFFDLSPGYELLYVSLTLLALTPWMYPVITHIKKDLDQPHSPVTKAGAYSLLPIGIILALAWYLGIGDGGLLFLSVLLVSLFFHIDSRIFFVLALASLIVTITSLLYGVETVAESASILAYLCLVLGIVSELGASYFDRYHQGSPIIIPHGEQILHEYKIALADYSSITTLALGSIIVLLIIGRGMLWNYELPLLFFTVLLYWGLSALTILIHRGSESIEARIETESVIPYQKLPRVVHIYRHFIAAMLLALFVDIAYFRGLEWSLQLLIILIGTVIMLLGVHYTPRIITRIRQYF